MSIDRHDNERLKLYERFKEALAEGNDTEFFDADDLVIIIDQAVDLQDEYVQIEALMRGYRFFPDNEELASRRAYLYFDLNIDAGVRNMVEHKRNDAPIWDLLGLRMREGDDSAAEETREILAEIIRRPEKFDDETMIQLVDCASACGMYDWLKENEALLRKKTDYLPTLLYELFIVADMRSDNEYSLKLLEELTELEPFNVEFWAALAQTQCNADNLDAAMTSIDYALAIDSENVQVLTLKASILIRREYYVDALKILEPLYASAPSALAGELKVRAYFGASTLNRTYEVLSEVCAAYPENRSLMEVALFLHPADIDRLLDMHYAATPAEERNDWHDWARRYYISGQLAEASAIYQCLRRNKMLNYAGYKMLATALYCSDNFEQSILLLSAVLDDEPAGLMPDVITSGLLSLIRTGQKRVAKTVFKKVTKAFPLSIREDWTLTSSLEHLGFTSFMSMVHAMLERRGPIDIEEIDIFHFPHNYRENDEEEV